MNQKYEKFISILNRWKTTTQTKDDLEYLNKKCVRPAATDPSFPYLFYKNKDVSLHKNKMLSIVSGNEISSIYEIDQEE